MFSPRAAALAVTGSITVLLILLERHRLAPSLRSIAVELRTITTVMLFVSPSLWRACAAALPAAR
jgi:hypothetical protein